MCPPPNRPSTSETRHPRLRRLSPQQRPQRPRTVVSLTQIAIEPLLMLWIVSAATDGAIRGPLRSARVTGWLYFWALALFFVGRLPVNAAHQLLNRYAMGKPDIMLWPMLVIDAVVVGLIISVIPALYVRIARFIWERQVRGTTTSAPVKQTT